MQALREVKGVVHTVLAPMQWAVIHCGATGVGLFHCSTFYKTKSWWLVALSTDEHVCVSCVQQQLDHSTLRQSQPTCPSVQEKKIEDCTSLTQTTTTPTNTINRMGCSRGVPGPSHLRFP